MTVIIIVLAVVVLPTLTAVSFVSGFDITPTVDQNSRVLLTGSPTIYKFGTPNMRNITYSDGSVVPSVTMTIEQYNQTTKHWEIIGYVNDHLHKLKIDNTDKIDISIGHTERLNIKTVPTNTLPTFID